jgi:hypothetical protein
VAVPCSDKSGGIGVLRQVFLLIVAENFLTTFNKFNFLTLQPTTPADHPVKTLSLPGVAGKEWGPVAAFAFSSDMHGGK